MTPQLYVDIVFIVIFSTGLYWLFGLIRALGSDAPYVPMKQEIVERMVALAHAENGGTWFDLGSGDGRVLIAASRRYPVSGIGIERVQALRWYSRILIFFRGLTPRIRIRKADLFATDVSSASVVSFYLLPVGIEKLIPKLRRELKPGARILTHRFPLLGVAADLIDEEYKIYRATVPF